MMPLHIASLSWPCHCPAEAFNKQSLDGASALLIQELYEKLFFALLSADCRQFSVVLLCFGWRSHIQGPE